ncbi:alpha/beta hydrolase [Aliiglaciecola sp. CAU 1673]|uniref:alpha/beta hydrolase n=1 Tax=Aliiglaciecola sp. CAU 1673 TaxID=3032595 RepID=UPI0023DAB6C9|nr:alpha/beta hydrolase [Aliiglaciecola sp. CAU 1673]MDF2176957.1 alpha/beta hydrolase [Aliiglaciecola sp. CAU 1673]
MSSQSPSKSRYHGFMIAAQLCIGLLLCGVIYQQIGQMVDRMQVSAPGKFVQVDGVKNHLFCTGQGHPTVLLEAGATGFAQTWAWVQSSLSDTARVCSYDRPGMGWSQSSDLPADGLSLVKHLKSLLDAADEQGPYLLVGHSMGGPLMQIFAGHYPDEVAGLILVDPAHPQQMERFSADIREKYVQFYELLEISSLLAPTGLLRLTNYLGDKAKDLPEVDYRVARLFASSSTHIDRSVQEISNWQTTMAEASRFMNFGSMPLTVLSASADPRESVGFSEQVNSLHEELSKMSKQGKHIRLDAADHFSILMREAHAHNTSESIKIMLEEIRGQDVQARRHQTLSGQPAS